MKEKRNVLRDRVLCGKGKTCIYSDFEGGTCDYLLITGQLRGCPADENCEKYTARKRRRKGWT